MKIQVNKHYINARGDVIFIKEFNRFIFYPFRDSKDNGYNTKGRYIDSNTDDITFDLICECVPDILAYYTDNCITQKEFIQHHIDYYIKSKE